jgi:hypothetical protein
MNILENADAKNKPLTSPIDIGLCLAEQLVRYIRLVKKIGLNTSQVCVIFNV